MQKIDTSKFEILHTNNNVVDHKKKYKELSTYIVIISILFIIFSIMVGYKIGKMKKEINDKDKRIWELEVTIEDMKGR